MGHFADGLHFSISRHTRDPEKPSDKHCPTTQNYVHLTPQENFGMARVTCAAAHTEAEQMRLGN